MNTKYSATIYIVFALVAISNVASAQTISDPKASEIDEPSTELQQILCKNRPLDFYCPGETRKNETPKIELSPEDLKILCEHFSLNSRCLSNSSSAIAKPSNQTSGIGITKTKPIPNPLTSEFGASDAISD